MLWLIITDHRPTESLAFTIPVQAGANIYDQAPQDLLSFHRPRWKSSSCAHWSIIIPNSVAVGQVRSVKQAAIVPSSPCAPPSSPPLAERLQNRQMGEKWGFEKQFANAINSCACGLLGHGGCGLLFRIW